MAWAKKAALASREVLGKTARFARRDDPDPVPELHSSFRQLPDGPIPAAFDSGQPMSANANTPVIAGGAVRQAGPLDTYYLLTPDMGASVARVGQRFFFTPGTGTLTATASATLAVTDRLKGTDDDNLKMALHFWVTRTQWTVELWDGSAAPGSEQIGLAGGGFLLPLNHGTAYEMEAWIDYAASTIHYSLPDGGVDGSVTDPRIAQFAGRFAFFEGLKGSNENDYVNLTHVWASTKNFGKAAPPPMRRQGNEVVRGMKYLLDGIWLAGSFTFLTGGGAGKVLTSDAGGNGTWQYPAVPAQHWDAEIHSRESTARALGTMDAPLGVVVPRALNLTRAHVRFGTAAGGGSTVVQLKKNGSATGMPSITIAAPGTSGVWTGSVALAQDDVITVEITTLGTSPGTGMATLLSGAFA